MFYRLAMRSIHARAEINPDTDKMDVRGLMGLDELTSDKWLGFGNGQIRRNLKAL